jgi:cytochrome c oxidase cbb3-type subunit III
MCFASPSPKPKRTLAIVLVSCAVLALAACKREEREFRPENANSAKLGPVPLVNLEPGGDVPPKNTEAGKDYEQNAYHLNQGKTLFSAFNCNGCHSNGGGGMWPPLIDDVWIYGSDFVNIAASIRDGRPNGMPSFGRLLPPDQLYELAAYVRSLGGFVPTNAAPSRNDSLQSRPAENRLQEKPESSPGPPAGNPPPP